MNETYYYLEPSITFSGLTKIAGEVVHMARQTYGGCLVSQSRMQEVMADINQYAADRLAANPRCKAPMIAYVHRDYTADTTISIDGWHITCKAVKQMII